jgi:hypothetical protein
MGAPEQFALAHPAQGFVQRPPGKAQRGSTHRGAEHVEHRHGDLEACARLANQRFGRHPHTVEVQPGQRVRRDHLQPLGNLQARRIGRHQEGTTVPSRPVPSPVRANTQ